MELNPAGRARSKSLCLMMTGAGPCSLTSGTRCCNYTTATSKRSAFITLVQAATKSFTNFSFESAHA